MRRACRASVAPWPYAANRDRSESTWERAMEVARDYAQSEGVRHIVRRRRPYDPLPVVFGPWIIQQEPTKEPPR